MVLQLPTSASTIDVKNGLETYNVHNVQIYGNKLQFHNS
jgi:hypothetical protein